MTADPRGCIQPAIDALREAGGLLTVAHDNAWWPGHGATRQSRIGSTRRTPADIATPRPGEPDAVHQLHRAAEQLTWAARHTCRALRCADLTRPPPATPTVGQLADLTADAMILLAQANLTTRPLNEASLRKACAAANDAAATITRLAHQPALVHVRRCRRNGCEDPDTGQARTLGNRRGDICDACSSRDKRARAKQRGAA